MKITYVHHSSFLVELETLYLLFDYTEGRIPELQEDKPLLVFASHRHGDHYAPVIFEIKQRHERTRYVLSADIWRKRLPQEALDVTDSLKHGERAVYGIVDGTVIPQTGGGAVVVTTYRSTDEGVAFLVEAEGKTVYHAGDLNNWTWEGEEKNWNASMAKKYSAQIDKMAGMHMDAAFLPLDPRQEDHFYLGMDEFLRKVKADRVFPMHCWGDFSVIGKIKGMECSASYRDVIVDIHEDGEEFEL